MSNKLLYILWGVLYIICAGLGFIAAPEGVAYGLCILFSLVFFLPPAIVLRRAGKANDKKALRRMRNICLVWFICTLVMLIVNILSIGFSETGGRIVYYILILVSAPMICSQIWVISLFLWACLLAVSWKYLRK